ncbi:MAG TPA: hypothetical protein PK264_18855 [Hyphomicrobiaceae bacterium]|nr:hypothetical protein [Hyphomicrobiaceae bacterium]
MSVYRLGMREWFFDWLAGFSRVADRPPQTRTSPNSNDDQTPRPARRSVEDIPLWVLGGG